MDVYIVPYVFWGARPPLLNFWGRGGSGPPGQPPLPRFLLHCIRFTVLYNTAYNVNITADSAFCDITHHVTTAVRFNYLAFNAIIPLVIKYIILS